MGAAARVAQTLPAELLREHAGHPPRVPAVAAAAPAFEARLVLAATLSPSYGIYSGFEQLRERAGAARAPRSTSTRRSTSSKQRTLDGPLLPLVARAERGAAREPGAAAARQRHVPRDRERAAVRATSSGPATTPSIVVVNLDPARDAGRRLRPAGLDRPAAGVPRARPARRDDASGRGTSAATTSSSRPGRATS